MSQIEPLQLSTITAQKKLIHDLRDRLNTIQSAAMVLERAGSVTAEHRKYVDWILEKATEADGLVDQLGQLKLGD